MNVKFLGAARQVTGSSYLLESSGRRVLVDHGMFQERAVEWRNWRNAPAEARSVDAVILTHAHLDHCGLLPKLVREGFRGPIFATAPTIDLAEIVLEDSAEIQQEDVEFKRKRHQRDGRTSPHPYDTLYGPEDVRRTIERMRPVRYGESVEVAPGFEARFSEAGHILGSAVVQVRARHDGSERTIAFSGDLGQWNLPIVGDPTLIGEADAVIMESTYGDRDHERTVDIETQLAEIVRETVRRGGNVVIPTFAIERAQEVLLHLSENLLGGRMPGVPVFLDSPMAIDATEVFLRHPAFMDERARATIASGRLQAAARWVRLCRTREQSRSINDHRGPCIILAGSGMCTAGRIKHHLVRNLGRPESAIVFVGYQASGTLGREILEGRPEVRIHGRMHDVRAQVRAILGLSAHAGRSDLLRWLRGFSRPPKRLFLTHGEESVSLAFAERVREELHWDVVVPEYLEEREVTA